MSLIVTVGKVMEYILDQIEIDWQHCLDQARQPSPDEEASNEQIKRLELRIVGLKSWRRKIAGQLSAYELLSSESDAVMAGVLDNVVGVSQHFPQYKMFFQFQKDGTWFEYHAESEDDKQAILDKIKDNGWQIYGKVVYKRGYLQRHPVNVAGASTQ